MSAFEYEFGSAFEIPDDECFWVSSKVDGAYAEETMILSVVPMAALEHEDEDDARTKAADLNPSSASCPDVTDADELRPSPLGSCW
jgi:hypothetical protein